MDFETIHGFSDFCRELRKSGFAVGGGNAEGIFTLCDYFGENIIGHTENPETDPWEWRIRALRECGDLAYGKLFFRKGGWITKEWYPSFLAVRREGITFQELYEEGRVSNLEKRIYQAAEEGGQVSLHDLKIRVGCAKSEASKFETALTGLQMKMLLTICGETSKLSRAGLPFGWPVTTFCTVERFFGAEVFEESKNIAKDDAAAAIEARIRELNPGADAKAIRKFIFG